MTGPFDTPDMALVVHAPAKINLALHVVGQRVDGHHLLESVVTFADRGDRVMLALADEDRFTLSGPFSDQLSREAGGRGGNLVLAARDLLRDTLQADGYEAQPVQIHLEKNLPIASGIGGGSADAAATLKGLTTLWQAESAAGNLVALGLALGADVPMCLEGRPLIARGIGEEITALDMPAFHALLVNPLVGVSTPAVFRALAHKTNAALDLPENLSRGADWLGVLDALRNDLQPPALSLEPAIGAVLEALELTGAPVLRMSGSGATCFALYATAEVRDQAAVALTAARPDWFVMACETVSAV
ncbi:4-(cytidine 5'-diphospho)-2-C-methyl-D-erythritol kinase [Rhizobium sp. YIM 134829]|uniref:4-(cytidine 5'-diphospho)-2-C-methyl-D-erythritol kinase n=1 Tax=Rhizobium sp. YIM 134829 TaxID=3390453 RepID=UPI00397A3DE2